MTADVALTLGDPNGIGPENRNQGGFASGGDRQDISRSGGRPHVMEHYMQLLDYLSAAIRFVEQGYAHSQRRRPHSGSLLGVKKRTLRTNGC